MQIEWYCLAVHKNTFGCTLSMRGLRNRPTKKVGFRHLLSLLSHTELLTSIASKLKQLLSYFMHRTISLSS